MSHWEWAVAVLVAVMSVARTARFIVYDEMPPMQWVKTRILARYKEDSNWAKLWECQFCVAPYLTAGMGLWMWLSGLDTIWWVVNGWWAASYAAAIIVAYDDGS